MTRPRLLILSFSDISKDARVLKQVELFADRYDVTTYGYGPSPDRRVQHLQLDDSHGIRRWRRSDLILRRFNRIYWRQAAIRQTQADLTHVERFDVILANDIDAVGIALALEPTHGVHADIHEYAPKQNYEILVWRLFIAPYATWMCRRFLPKASSMTTVGQGLADEYARKFGVRCGVVTNATPLATLTPQPVGTPIRLVHSGASMPNRRLEVLVDSAIATKTDVVLDLYLMGNNPEYIDRLRKRAAGSDRVRFPDPLPYRDLIARLNEYDVGLPVIPPTTFSERWALPNKFFDYVQARLGVIIGPSPEMQHLLDIHKFGVTADGFGTSAITKALDALTPEEIFTWKVRADESAHSLSAGPQNIVWDEAIAALVKSSPV